ncbi:VirB4-like conjugal transfer ATPase, CD1110 family [Huintestinicola butyrica]|uniref:VirB4-like conjugal transfer ATPase, CD1110 family n=1 Tax=Huintestinicola butyrica TaxID=2981728 RepID=UPI003F800D35
MNENETVTGTTALTESVTAVPVSEVDENAVSDTDEMTKEAITETESEETSLSLPEGIDAEALVSSIAAEGVSEVMSEIGITEEITVETEAVTQPVITEATVVTEQILSETEIFEAAEIVTEAAEVTDIVAEETEISEVVTVPETPNGVMGFVQNNPAVVGVPAAIIALAVAFLAVTRRTRPKRGIIEDTDDVKENMNARERDAARLEANKPKKKDKRSQKVAKEKEKKDFAKKVLNTLPYKKILSDDIFFLGKKMYSKAYTFDDINFNLSDEEQQYMYLERYIEFLSILDDTVDCQICCWNSQINLDDLKKKTLLPQKADDLFEYRYEFNSRVLEENIRKGQNAIQKHMYITLTIKAPDEETARRRFKSLDITATNTFNRIGNTNMRVLTSQERVEMLKDFFVGTDDMPVPQLTEKDYEKGIDKLYCAPDYFDFKKDYFMFNNTYAKTIYIREYPSTATSEILTELLATGIEIMVTTNIETYDSAEARKLVQHQITAIDTDMAKREVKAAQHGNFSNQMPQRIKNQRDAMVSVYDKITMKDQKLFMTNMQILIKAESFEELNNNLEVIESTLKRSGCIKGEMAWEQEHGMCDCLPVGYQRKFGWLRTMPSESVAIFMPFNVKEMQMENSVYYGLNMLSHNIILFDRMKGLVNPSGFVLACPGSGKSFTVKREIVNVFLGYDDADILVIDPEREYWKLAEAFGGEVVKFSNGSKNHINPFDFDFRLLEDEEIDIIADKCQLLTSFISCMDSKHPLNAQEKSFVDRCVRKAYAKSNVLTTLDPKDMPTLGTFLECMKEETENINKDMKDKLIITVDMYVNGSAKYFDNQTNVNTKSRFIAYDIRDLNGNLKTQSMLLILDYIWNRLSENRDKGRKTYIYFDEAHLLFQDEYSLDYLRMLWKRARKYGGVLTGITQNVEDLLKDDKSRSMLSNSEFLVLLKQNPTDAAKLQDILHFTDSEIQYVNDTPAGHGILVLGGKTKIPFYDEFPKDTKLYSMMTTNFSETAKMLQEEMAQKEADAS